MESSEKSTAEKPRSYTSLDGFLVEQGMAHMLIHNVAHNINTLLLGPTGVGKTELVVALAKLLKKDVTIFDMGTMTDPVMSLIGTHAITVVDGKTQSEFKPSRFSDAIQKPGIIVLDEASRAAAGSNNLLFPCLDFRRELPMEYSFEDSAPIKIHEDCVFIATANTGSQYTGTHKLDKAFVDRFMVLEVEELNTYGYKAVLSTVTKLDPKTIESIVNVYAQINKEHDDFKISFNLSMRHLKTIAKLVENGFTIYDSFYAICKGIGGKEGLETVKSIISVDSEKKSAPKFKKDPGASAPVTAAPASSTVTSTTTSEVIA